MAGDKLALRPAATLLLLRDGNSGPEAFLLQRTLSAAFLAGAHVFPGGALDRADGDARALRRVTGISDAQASARLGVESGGLAYWVAAVRECFEESGILLAESEDGRAPDAARTAALAQYRTPLHAGELASTSSWNRSAWSCAVVRSPISATGSPHRGARGASTRASSSRWPRQTSPARTTARN